ncbi:YHS domain protein [Flavobacterium sp. NRK F10]|uniref:YHS domain protein n=2 Tax=Flavobacterium sediminis TaxID=2201181 RepID=A0A2U8QSF0_9FLAO|nr:YHS domain-containing (seleno)protein [Flavobacterium sp. NRK F10]AWM12775.1 YHS domain protein [Flavobacterium sediminis]MCO6173898.1 YHS domain protein [Flavobacterium sp. NRK F10]
MKTKIVLLLILSFFQISLGQNPKENRNLESGVALQGYDPVSYFTIGKAVKGKKEFAVFVHNAIYYCSSLNHKKLVEANPERYEPQYGGWCAYAMGNNGSKVEINPQTFKIIDGKLYLFYNAYFSNTLKSWNKNETVLKKKADTNWLKITK